MPTRNKEYGFTLLELSLVLVIIGLISASVLVGRDLIRGAQVRKAVRQVEQLDTAVNTFRGKYNCFPGDCKNATNLGFSTVYHDSGADPNGNGDGAIRASTGESYQAVGVLYEAKLINDVRTHPYCCSALFLAIPSYDNTNGYPGIIDIDYFKSDPSNYSNISSEGNYYWLRGAPYVVTSGSTNILTPVDALGMDAKLDDGLPRSGRVLASGRAALGNNSYGYFPAFDSATDTGAAGATSNYCVTNGSPNQYNTSNASRAAGSLCTVTIKTSF